jgi:hypothetical protein
VNVVPAHAGHAHGGDSQFVAGSLKPYASQNMSRNDERRQADGDSSAPGQVAFIRIIRIHDSVSFD